MYRANAAAYAKSSTRSTPRSRPRSRPSRPPSRKLVTFHDAFPYFARHFGFELVGVVLQNVGQEPTASELAALVGRVKAAGVKAVFSEAQFSPKLAQTLADEAGDRRRGDDPLQRRPRTRTRRHVSWDDDAGTSTRSWRRSNRPRRSETPVIGAAEAARPNAMPPGGAPAIRLRGVAAGYGDRLALDGIDLDVRTGPCWRSSGPTGRARAPCSRSSPGCSRHAPGRSRSSAGHPGWRHGGWPTCPRPRPSTGNSR